MSNRYAIRDDQWSRIEHLLPGGVGKPGTKARDNRLFVNAVLHRYRAGIPWRDLPEHFGDFRVLHLRHSRWSKSGVWTGVFEVLAQNADNEYVMVDLTIDHCSGASAQCRGQKKGLKPTRPLDAAVAA